MSEEKNKTYQISLLLPVEWEESEVEKKFQEIKQIIQKQNGQIEEENPLSKMEQKDLAYPIKKQNQALFLNFNFNMPAEEVNELKRKLNLDKDLFRYLITQKQEIKEAPKAKKEKKIKKEKAKTKEDIESEIIDRIEPLTETEKEIKQEKEQQATREEQAEKTPEETKQTEKETETEEAPKQEEKAEKKEKKEKADIKDLDKKLDEILNE